MRKLFLFAITAILIAPNARAASVTDTGESSTYRCSQNSVSASTGTADNSLSPVTNTTGCSATAKIGYLSRNITNMNDYTSAYKEYCTGCITGSKLTTATDTSSFATDCAVTWTYCKRICQGTACEGYTTWRNDTGNAYRQIRCNTSTDKCEYKCKTNSYNPGSQIVGNPPNCKKCPDHAECYGTTTPPCCDVGYYLIDNNYIPPTPGMVTLARPKDYDCLRCPSVAGSDPEVIGTTTYVCYLEAPTPSYITSCYVRSGTTVNVPEGTFTVTGGDCEYEE